MASPKSSPVLLSACISCSSSSSNENGCPLSSAIIVSGAGAAPPVPDFKGLKKAAMDGNGVLV